MRLIDADALIGKTIIGGRRNNKTIIRYIVTNIVQNAPTVDAVPVIRCKDCKYWTQNPFGGKVGFCNKHKDIAIACDETDFCSWAERKEE